MIQTIRIDFWGIRKYTCARSELHDHLPHIWFDQETARRYFCSGRGPFD